MLSPMMLFKNGLLCLVEFSVMKMFDYIGTRDPILFILEDGIALISYIWFFVNMLL